MTTGLTPHDILSDIGPKKPELQILCLQQHNRLALVLISVVLSKTHFMCIIQKRSSFQGCGLNLHTYILKGEAYLQLKQAQFVAHCLSTDNKYVKTLLTVRFERMFSQT